ncbi:MAG: FimV/HubP family polar landmark protein [Thermomonas sp.]
MLLCASLPVFALGLGQIVVKSKPGQPLAAEIPIISSDPDELQGLQAQLASPETFARVGLAPPTGLVADLDFSFDQDAAGRPLIRVTTQQPVQQPELVFLLEVDWGSGRLVREYSALVDAPQSVAAPAPEPLQMPTPAPADTVERTPLPETQPAPVAQTPAPAPVPEPTPSNAVPPSVPVAPPAPAPAPVAASAANAGGSVSVQRGDTLGRIAADLGSGRSLDQTMLALLRANPDAFIDGNVNLVKAGAVLRVPDAAELDAVDRQQAAAIVQQQVQRWRGSRSLRAQPQPEATASTRAGTGEAHVAAPRSAGARLEIAPPSSSDAKRAGTRSGIEAGGEGEMLQQELQQTKETLSARDAEVAELKTRVADLEKLQKEQQQLISMKDSALAGAQQDLAKAREARTAQEPASPAQQAHAFAWWPWLLLAIAVAALAAWLLRRRRGSVQSLPPRFDSASLAAAVPKAAPAPEAPVAGKPAWTREEARPAPTPPPAVPAKPVWQAPQADTIVPLNTAPAGRERLELARAYIELGDDATARSLLLEVIDGGDLEARAEAQRLLGGMA